jgi:xanthine phosphoribosyltransferase
MTEDPHHDYRRSQRLALAWSDIERDSRALALRLVEHGPFRGIVAVARGGLVPAALIARALDLHHIDTVCVWSYTGQVQGELQVIKSVDSDGEGWLVIDDLVDSGATARLVRAMLPRAHYATLYAKPQGRPLVDTHCRDIDQEVWLVFPWDEEAADA